MTSLPRSHTTKLLAVAAVGVAAAGRAVQEARWRDEVARLRGRGALVAGGSRGLGLLIAAELARLGMQVMICARDAEELQRAHEQLAAEGLDVHTRVCDVSALEQVDALVASATQTLGSIEVLITVAGIIQVGPAQQMTLADYEASMATTFWGGVYLSRAVLPQMRERGSGHIATIASIGGRISIPHLLPYASAKFASVGYHEGLRAEVAGTGVSVTTVLPGLMRTGSHVNAEFIGRQADEYSWFATAASVPVVAMDAHRAARRIVRAVVLGRPELQLPAYTHVATRMHGLMPATTVRLLGVAARMLPAADRPRSPGDSSAGSAGSRWAARYRRSGLLRRVTAAGSRAADTLNQRGVARHHRDGAGDAR